MLHTSTDPFESPMMGIVVGVGILSLGIVSIIFAPPISRFVSSVSGEIYSKKWVDALAKTQVVRLRIMGAGMVLGGGAVLVIGTVSALQGL